MEQQQKKTCCLYCGKKLSTQQQRAKIWFCKLACRMEFYAEDKQVGTGGTQ